MKAGVTMRKRSSMELSSLIIFLSIISIILQFAAYLFFTSPFIILGISSVVVILSIHILLEQSLTYKACTLYTILTLFISTIITLLIYFGADTKLLPFTKSLLGILALNWLIPVIHCFIRHMFDYGSRIEHFNSFYRNVNIIFLLFYITVLIYISFGQKTYPRIYPIFDSVNFTPFWTSATQIENYINHMIPFSDIFIYFISRILIYMPYGYYGILLLRNTSKFIWLIYLLLLPSTIELIQYLIIPGKCDIDDLIYGLIGGAIGALLFYLTNAIYRWVSGKNFLSKGSKARYSNKPLYF